MKTSIKTIALILLSTAMISSCRKKEPTDPGITFSSLSEVLTRLKPVMHQYTFDAAAGQHLVTPEGVHVYIQANSLLNPAGNPVTGNVQLNILPLINRTAMLLAGIPPVSNQSPLISGGEFQLSLVQNGERLHTIPWMPVEMRYAPATTDLTNMQLFFGAPDDTVGINWAPVTDSANFAFVVGGDTVIIDLDSLDYCNADAFMVNPNYVPFSVTVNGATGVDHTNTQMFAVYDGRMGYWPMGSWGASNNGNVFDESHVPDIPVHIVAITVVGGKLYYGVTGVTPASGATYQVNLAESTLDNITASIAALP